MAKRKPRVREVCVDVQLSLSLYVKGVSPEDAEATAEREVQDYLDQLKRDCEFRVDEAEILSVTAESKGKDEDDGA